MTVHSIALGPQDLAETAGSRQAVDAKTLKQVAESGGGKAFRVRTLADLQTVFGEIDRLNGSPTSGPTVGIYQDLWAWPAGLAFLAALGLLTIQRREA